MNAIVPQQLQLPAYLQALALPSIGAAVVNGITGGASIYQIGLKQSRFRLQSPSSEEQLVDALHLDVIIVGANTNKSHSYYATKYDPKNTEFKAPDCWSDNGIGPSNKADNPQSAACATCPHNVWGTGTSASGAPAGKACQETKKMAVLLADNPTGPVYLLRIPPASLANLKTFVDALNSRNIPVSALVARVTFDGESDYPKLVFKAAGWISEDQANAVRDIAGSDEIDIVTGAKDIVREAPIATKQTTAPAPVQETPKRVRTPKVVPEAAPVQEAPNLFAALAAKATNDMPVVNHAAAVSINPAPTDAGLDALLSGIL